MSKYYTLPLVSSPLDRGFVSYLCFLFNVFSVRICDESALLICFSSSLHLDPFYNTSLFGYFPLSCFYFSFFREINWRNRDCSQEANTMGIDDITSSMDGIFFNFFYLVENRQLFFLVVE